MTSREITSPLTLSENCPSVFVSNDLVHLIQSPTDGDKQHTQRKEEGKGKKAPPALSLMRMDELLKHVKNYILQHKLYDEKNPLKILLHNNELGLMLGKSELSLLDVRDVLLQKFVFPAEINSSEVICSISDKLCVSKRKLEKNGDSDYSIKRIKQDEREGDAEKEIESCLSFDSDESMHSYQDYETEFVHDATSDSSERDFIFAETYDVDVEYEIASDNGEFSCESESDLEDFVKSAIITFIAQIDTDLEYLGDESSGDESEKELSEEDKWQCASCGKKSHPLMRCCSFCWRTRSGWLPESSERQNERNIRKREQKKKKKAKRIGKK